MATTIYVFCEHCGTINEIKTISNATKIETLWEKAVKGSVCEVCASSFPCDYREEYKKYIATGSDWLKYHREHSPGNGRLGACFNKLGADTTTGFKSEFRKECIEKAEYSIFSRLEENLKKNNLNEKKEVSKVCFDDLDSLKSHVKLLIDLEAEEFFLKKQIAQMTQQKRDTICTLAETAKRTKKAADTRFENKVKKIKEEFKKSKEEKQNSIKDRKKAFEAIVWESIVGKTKPVKPNFLALATPIKPIEPIPQKPGLFNKKRVLKENEEAEQRYRTAMQQYQAVLLQNEENEKKNEEMEAAYRASLAEFQEAVKLAEKEEKERMQKDIEQLENELAEAKQKFKDAEKELKEKHKNSLNGILLAIHDTPLFDLSLEKLEEDFIKVCKEKEAVYSLNAIYPTYRGLIPLTSFYEYLNSGRCKELEGSDGAYNLYEAECRANIISTVFIKIEEINQKQVILIKTLTEVNERLEKSKNLIEKAHNAVNKKKLDKREKILFLKQRKQEAEEKGKIESKDDLRLYFDFIAEEETYRSKLFEVAKQFTTQFSD